jgi:hypothetical protein
MTATENAPVRPALAQPTGYRVCDRLESRIIGYVLRYVESKEGSSDNASVPPDHFMMMAYGVAVARQIFAEERREDNEIFAAIAAQEPRTYIGDIAWCIRMLSRRMRGKLLTYGNDTREGRRAQQIILEGGNP